MSETKELIVAEELTPETIFKAGGMDPVLEKIREKAEAHVPDITTAKGRKAIASNAAKVASSKTLLDKMGKTLKDQYKVLIDPIDGERRKTREFLDALKIKVRKPLAEWEGAETKRKAEEKAKAEYESAWDEALAEDAIFNREREIKRKEEELARIEAERVAKEEAERSAEEARIKAEQEAKARA